jgi:hypothetical protein
VRVVNSNALALGRCAPARLKRDASGFGLPIALRLLAVGGQVACDRPCEYSIGAPTGRDSYSSLQCPDVATAARDLEFGASRQRGACCTGDSARPPLDQRNSRSNELSPSFTSRIFAA